MNDDMVDQLINDQAGLFRPGWIAKRSVYGVGERTARGDGRVAWSSSCSRNAHDKNVLAWDKSASRRARGWAGEIIAHNRGSARSSLKGNREKARNRWGMEPDDLLCSRNARSQKTLVGRAQWETHPGHPGATYTSKLEMTIVVRSLRPC